MKYRALTMLLVCLGCCVLAGCQSLSGPKEWFAKEEEEIVYETPSKIVAIWTNSVFNEGGKPPVRGLGGRLYFYDDDHQPIQVDGKLSVFLYDDTEPDGRKKQEASKTIHFTPEQVASKFTPTDFGASYSFWVPWDEVGGERAQLSVIPVFTSDEGEMLVGDQARHLLPGRNPIEFIDEMEEGGSEVQQASFIDKNGNQVAKASAVEDAKFRMKSSTIKLPPTMQQRLRQGWPQHRRTEKQIKTRVSEPAAEGAKPENASSVSKSDADSSTSGETILEESAAGNVTMESQPTHSQLGPLQAQALQSARQEISRARTPLGRAASLIGR